MTEVKAQLNNFRIAPRKVRSVANLIKRKNAESVENELLIFFIKKIEI